MVVSKNKIVKNASKFKQIKNYYSYNDYITKYIFDNFEKNHEPIGLTPLCDGSVKKINDFNTTKTINRHSDYLTKLEEIITNSY